MKEEHSETLGEIAGVDQPLRMQMHGTETRTQAERLKPRQRETAAHCSVLVLLKAVRALHLVILRERQTDRQRERAR